MHAGNIAVMPIRFALPLPGPFVWTPGRRTQRRPQSFRHTAWYLLLGWPVELAFWMITGAVIGSVWLAWIVIQATIALLLWLAADAAQAYHEIKQMRGHE
jgi:hypothetical protein